MSNAHIALAITAAAAASFGTEAPEINVAPPPDIDPDLPKRLSVERMSRHYIHVGPLVGVKLDGEEVVDVIEYDAIGGWVRIASRVAGKIAWSAGGRALNTMTLYGRVEPYWRAPPTRQVRRQLRRKAA